MEKKTRKTESIRLNVILQEHGIASRRKADEMIEAGLIRVNGKIEKTLGIKVEKTDEILVDGKKISKKPTKVTYIFHKPYLTMTSRSDDRGRPTIYDLPLLKKLPGNVQPVGRLDFKSEGLLILTNDGDLALALSHPKYSVEKVYSVLLSTQISIEEVEKLKRGVQLDDGPAKPLYVKSMSREKLANSTGQWVEIAVLEGRNRLVRRMMESLGLRVVKLLRIAVGDIRLPASLPSGKMRLVNDAEKKYLDEVKKNLAPENAAPKKRAKPAAAKKPVEKTPVDLKKKKEVVEPYAQKIASRQKKVQTLARERKKTFNERTEKK